RAVIFDDRVRRDPAGAYRLTTYEVRAPGEPARVELSELTLLKGLPLAEPQRLLFGARLSEIGRGDGGTWVIRFDRDSGVLRTDEVAASACCPLDADLRPLLKRQSEWATGLP